MKIENGVLIEFEDFAQHVVFPRDMTAISEDVYEFVVLTNDIETITVEEGNPVYHSAGNCLIETATGTLVLGCKNSVIPNDGTVTKIGKLAFDSCQALTKIEIPEGVTKLDYMAFAYTGLEEVIISESVTKIAPLCFALNSDLKRVIIKGKNVNFGRSAFATSGEIKKPDEGTGIPTVLANNLTIVAPIDSTVYEYAKKFGIDFEEL